MSTVAEIEDAVKRLPLQGKLQLLASLGRTIAEEQLRPSSASAANPRHSALEIPTVTLTALLQPDLKRTVLLDEMLEDRF
jgi:hypothetical protein